MPFCVLQSNKKIAYYNLYYYTPWNWSSSHLVNSITPKNLYKGCPLYLLLLCVFYQNRKEKSRSTWKSNFESSAHDHKWCDIILWSERISNSQEGETEVKYHKIPNMPRAYRPFREYFVCGGDYTRIIYKNNFVLVSALSIAMLISIL